LLLYNIYNTEKQRKIQKQIIITTRKQSLSLKAGAKVDTFFLSTKCFCAFFIP